ncbi:MAG: helix-turn-helix transcriptional regulator [Clostridia bacterium]|nr:helix-turn-helix transcriptional regulator [Clostridia bacterium]
MEVYDKRLIGARLKQLRLYHDWTQRYIHAKTGISPQKMSKMESGNGGITIPILIKLSQLYNIKASYILFGNGKIMNDEFNQIYQHLTDNQKMDLDCALIAYGKACKRR